MAHKTLIGGTAYEVSGGKTLIGGTAYKIAKGRTLVGGTGYDISFAPPPLQIYSVGTASLQNGVTQDSNSNQATISSNYIKISAKYGWSEGVFGFYLPVDSMVGYTKLVVTAKHNVSSGAQRAIIGWGNNIYVYNSRFYNPSQYSLYGTTKYEEVSFLDATAYKTYTLDVSSVAGTERFGVSIRFKGRSSGADTWSDYALITDIHFE